MKEFSSIPSILKGATVFTGETDYLMKVALKLSTLDEGKSMGSDSESLASFNLFFDFYLFNAFSILGF